MQTALESEPSHAAGHLAFAEARMEHLFFFDGDREASLKVAVKGVETAETAGRLLEGDSIEEPLRSRLRERLATVFAYYGTRCEALGDPALVERCQNRGPVEVTTLGTAKP